MTEKLMPECVACDDKPAAGNNPCAVCGATRHPTPAADEVEAGDAAFLRDLAKRLMHVPAVHVDGGDIDELNRISAALQARSAEPAQQPDIWTDRFRGTWCPGDEA